MRISATTSLASLKRVCPSLLALSAVLAAVSAPAAEVVEDCQTPDCAIDGAHYKIVVPDGWNPDTDTLVLYAHGLFAKADQPNEMNDTRPPIAPPGAEAPAQCAGDPPGPDTTDNGAGCDAADIARALLDAGYALAGSAYRDLGYVPQLARVETLALYDHFVSEFGLPARTLWVGQSMGSLPAYELAEDPNEGRVDGFITLGGLSAGNTRTLDFFIAFQVGLDALGFWDPNWGVPGNLRNDLDYETEVIPSPYAVQADNGGDPKLEFLRRVLGASANFATESGELAGGLVRPLQDAAENAELRVSMSIIDQFVATAGVLDVERRYGEGGLQNLDQEYCLSASDKEALAAPPYNLSAETVDGYLTEMNNHDIGPGYNGVTQEQFDATRATLDALTPFTGALLRPVLAVKSPSDGVTLPYLDTLYRRDVAAAQRSHLLVQQYVVQTTHSNNFTPEQMVDAVRAMDEWVKTGVAPVPADPVAFPPGFDSPEGHGWDPSFVSPPSPFECLPEPGAVLSLAAGIALLFGLRRRRP